MLRSTEGADGKAMVGRADPPGWLVPRQAGGAEACHLQGEQQRDEGMVGWRDGGGQQQSRLTTNGVAATESTARPSRYPGAAPRGRIDRPGKALGGADGGGRLMGGADGGG